MASYHVTPLQFDWKGGFPPKGSPMQYPTVDLSSLPMFCNMSHIPLLQRQLGVKYPEFTWETGNTLPGRNRCYRMFAPYISRIGYTDRGRIYSIICPQQGVWIKDVCLNAEITVTGQRGWVNEDTKELAADMTVEARIWFSPTMSSDSWLFWAWPLLKLLPHAFPVDKEHAILVTTHCVGNPDEPIFTIRDGQTTDTDNPPFTQHDDAWGVGHINVGIGPVVQTGDRLVDDFNALVMDAFNESSGNMLQDGNTLTWNLWFDAPKPVNRVEWRHHAEKWRKSIDMHHGSPTGPGHAARYHDGTYFNADLNALERAVEELLHYLENHLDIVRER